MTSLIGPIFATVAAPTIQTLYPSFNLSDILTSDGIAALALLDQVGGYITSIIPQLAATQLVQPNWTTNPHVQIYQSAIQTGGKAISGPLFVIHGEADAALDINLTTSAVQRTAELYPDAQIKYVRVTGTSHNGATTACQWLWLDWISARFRGEQVLPGLVSRELGSPGAVRDADYQVDLNWWIRTADALYET